jgi:uncharacterized OsmC-like protein
MSDMSFSVKATAETAARTLIQARSFSLIVDEPEALGGTDRGANPVEYLLAAFAGCLNVVAHLVAREQGLDLRGLELAIEGELNPSRLLGEPSEDRAGFKSIRVRLIPRTNASHEAVLAWLKEVERRCPIHDNLTNPTPVSVEIASAGS